MERIRHRSARGFTLIELLCVMVISGLLIGFSVMAYDSARHSANLGASAAQVRNHLNHARQLAMTHNRISEVRFYLGGEPGGSARPILGVQTFVDMNADGTFETTESQSRLEWFPEGFSAAGDTVRSTLLQAMASGQAEIPQRGQVDYRSLRFRPDGVPLFATQPSSPDALSLMVAANRELAKDAALPTNFILFSLNPTTGRIRSFQP
jgi:uncharacterized protein (TIGR02596 family)